MATATFSAPLPEDYIRLAIRRKKPTLRPGTRRVGICRTVRVAPAANIPTRSGPQPGGCRTSLRSQSRRLWMFFCVSNRRFNSSAAKWTTVACAPGARVLLQGIPMAPKTIARLLILFAFATTGANLASAQGSGSGGSGFKAGGFQGGGGGNFRGRSSDGKGFHGRGFDRRAFHGQGFVGFGLVDGSGYGYDNGYGDWYGISPGHDECPLFRQRVMTRDGMRVRMIPIC